MSSRNPHSVSMLAVVTIILVIAVGFSVFAGAIIVVPGTVGIPVRFGKVQEETFEEGFHWVNPVTTKVEVMNVKTQKEELEAAASTMDLQDVMANVAINFAVDRKEAATLFNTVGQQYFNTVVMPVVMEVFKAESARYTAEELIVKRSELSQSLLTSLTEQLRKRGITVEGFSITQFQFSERFNDAVEKKIIAEQEALQAKNELEKTKAEAMKAEEQAKGEANAKKALAEGEAEAMLVKAKAEAEAITLVAQALQGNRDMLLYEALRTWDGKLPTHILSDTLTPVFDLAQPEEKTKNNAAGNDNPASDNAATGNNTQPTGTSNPTGGLGLLNTVNP